jgi:hypothetical protein
MRYIIQLFILAMLTAGLPASAADITSLAGCATRVFDEINRTHKWAGKTPVGCSAEIAVEQRPDGVFVTTWAFENAGAGWVRTAFTAAMGYDEIARKKELVKANRDIMARAGRLDRCLNSIITVNDPLECRDHATKSYLVGEETGTENQRLIWLDDNGRHTVAEYSFGDTESTPDPPADLFSSPPLPPGTILDLHLYKGSKGGAAGRQGTR